MNSNDHQGPEKADSRGKEPPSKVSHILTSFAETFGLSRPAAIGTFLFVNVVILAAVFWFIYSAPPRILIMTSGPAGSSFERVAERYRAILASNGVKLKVLPSEGSLENLKRLADPAFRVDIGFVQTGESVRSNAAPLFSLGSVAYQPLMIFYRSATPVTLLSDLAGRKVAVGPRGSGTRVLAMTLLRTNGIFSGAVSNLVESNGVVFAGTTSLLALDSEDAAKALLDGQIDAAFMMGDSASSQIMRNLLRAPEIHLYDFAQADAYARRFPDLNKMLLPRGSIDFGLDLPAHDVNLIGPTVELVARTSLHPALSDLLLETAQEVHGGATILQRRNEFPSPLEHELKISPDASRFYKSGKRLLYRSLNFGLASLMNRILVAFVPMLLVLIPGLKLIPTAYKWRVQLRIYRWYRSLLKVERELHGDTATVKREELRHRLEHIERAVNQMRVPASFAGQFFELRSNIGLVRDRLSS